MKSYPTTHAILEQYAAWTGDDHIYKMGRVRAAARNLASYGLQPEEVSALMDWLKAQPWVRGADLILAQTMYLRWRDETKAPSVEQQIEQVRTSHAPQYLGSVGERLRRAELAQLEAQRG